MFRYSHSYDLRIGQEFHVLSQGGIHCEFPNSRRICNSPIHLHTDYKSTWTRVLVHSKFYPYHLKLKNILHLHRFFISFIINQLQCQEKRKGEPLGFTKPKIPILPYADNLVFIAILLMLED